MNVYNTAMALFYMYPIIGLIARCVLTILVGVLVIQLINRFIVRKVGRVGTPHVQMLLEHFVYYVGSGIILVSVLHALGFQLTALLGAAGIFGAAVAFASQTSVANVISGIFLLAEHSFAVGDYIKVGEVEGTVLSIDLLSIKLKSGDNVLVRVPNEQIIRSSVRNFSHYSLRRIDFTLAVDYGVDMRSVVRAITDVIKKNPCAAQFNGTSHVVRFDEFKDNAVQVVVGVWVEQKNIVLLQETFLVDVKERFDQEGIPGPSLRIHTDQLHRKQGSVAAVRQA
jgi:small-conductance mechanosensitive channel